MVFWIGILVGGLFAWLAVKMGFYETWAFAFNIVISIYLAVFLSPIIAAIVPVPGDMSYNNALCMIAVAVAAFLILHGISYIFLTGQFSVSFPKVFDILGSGFLGFLAGLLVWGFVGLLIYTTPISQNPIVKQIGFSSQFEQCSMPVISWWCNLVNKVVSNQENGYTTEQAISEMLKKAEKKSPPKPVKQAEPNEPAEPNDLESLTK